MAMPVFVDRQVLSAASLNTISVEVNNLGATKAPLASPAFTGVVGGVSKAMVGLGSVDNTTDVAKPVSTATQNEINLHAHIAGQVFTGPVSATNLSGTNTGDQSLAAYAPLASPAFTGTPTGLTKAHVGLANVDNTTDLNKPASTAQLAVFAAKVEVVNTVPVSGAAQTIPAATIATVNAVTLSAACTFTFPAAAVGKSFSLVLISGGAFAVIWPAAVKWAGGTAPVLTTVAGKTDALAFACVDGTNWLGFVGGRAF